MKDNYIVPFLIIIVCIIFIYGLINYKYNNKLINTINTIENYANSSDITNFNQIQSNSGNALIQNINTTILVANGTWTYLGSKVNTDNTVNNLMKIDISNSNSGNITIPNGKSTLTINNISVTNGYITCKLNDYSLNYNEIIIKVVALDDTTTLSEISSQTYFVAETPLIVVSLFSNMNLINKFVCYKVYPINNQYIIDYNSKIASILNGSLNLITLPPKFYNYDVYSKITTNYKFSPNSLTIMYNNNPINKLDILNTIKTKYNGTISFAIQRIFQSPNDPNINISTPLSQRFNMKIDLSGNSGIPSSVNIVPINTDFFVNNIDSKVSFIPVSTILYFYKNGNTKISYKYKNDPIKDSSNNITFNNNSSSMYNNNLEYDNISSVYRESDNIYNITMVGVADTPNIDSVTTISLDTNIF